MSDFIRYRGVQVAAWTGICFLIAPSRVSAVAYSLLGGFLFICALGVMGILGMLSRGANTGRDRDRCRDSRDSDS